MNPEDPLFVLAKKIAGTPTFVSVQKSCIGWEITYTIDSMVKENSTKCKTRKFVAVFDKDFTPASTFELAEEIKFRHVHPSKNLTIIGSLFKNEESFAAEITIILDNGIVKKKLEEIIGFYTDSYFASPNPWFQNKYFLFIGERKLGENEFLYRETFGEKYDDKRNPTLMIINLDTFDIQEISIDGFYPMSPVFIGEDAIVLQGYPMGPHKLGIKFCLNRPTQIIRFDLKTKSVEMISDPTFSARSPRLVDSSIYYLQGPLYYSHFPACELICYDINVKENTVISPDLKRDHFEELLPIQANCKRLVINPIIGTVKQPFTFDSNSLPLQTRGEVLAALDGYIFVDRGYLASSIYGYEQRIYVDKRGLQIVSLFKNIVVPELENI